MQGRIGRLWQLRRAVGGIGRGPRQAAGPPGDAARASDGTAPQDELSLPGPDQPNALPPEQPVLLMPSGATRQVHVGELLPARRQPWPLSLVRVPTIPKRAILAAGLCAGLAAPTLARHLATRMILGRPTSGVQGVLEVTRIVYSGPLTPRAATAIGKVLEAGRR